MVASCTFTVEPGCCEHIQDVHDPDPLEPRCMACWGRSGDDYERYLHQWSAPVLCGHEESEHLVTYDPDTGEEPVWCRPCEHLHSFTVEVAA